MGRRARVLVASAAFAAGCGGESPSRPATAGPNPLPTPTPTPTATPTPRITIELTAPVDSGRYSTSLASLDVGRSFDIDFTPLDVHRASGQQYGNSIEFWLFADANVPSDLGEIPFLSSCLSFVWAQATGTWVVSWFAEGRYGYGSRRIPLPLGESRSLRIRRLADGTAEFLLDGEQVMLLVNPAASRLVFARVYAARATFSYRPGVFGSFGVEGGLRSPAAGAPSEDVRPKLLPGY